MEVEKNKSLFNFPGDADKFRDFVAEFNKSKTAIVYLGRSFKTATTAFQRFKKIRIKYLQPKRDLDILKKKSWKS